MYAPGCQRKRKLRLFAAFLPRSAILQGSSGLQILSLLKKGTVDQIIFLRRTDGAAGGLKARRLLKGVQKRAAEVFRTDAAVRDLMALRIGGHTVAAAVFRATAGTAHFFRGGNSIAVTDLVPEKRGARLSRVRGRQRGQAVQRLPQAARA